MNRDLTVTELSMVYKVIDSRMGLHFPNERGKIISRSLASAAIEFGFKNMDTFLQWFSYAQLNQEQMEVLASYLTISETYFWREPQVFEALSQNIYKDLNEFEKVRGRNINIWCAGCSTGEEAYSIAIALYRIIPEIKNWKITILATDINAKALDKAKIGKYGSWSFRNSPLWLKGKYFKKLNNNEFEIDSSIREMVTFSSFNLTNENYLSSICKDQPMDIIFCRNVLMYFTDEWAARISINLYHSLIEKGWLIVSSCELSSGLFPQFTAVNFPGAVFYHKNKTISSTHLNHSNNSNTLQIVHNLPLSVHDVNSNNHLANIEFIQGNVNEIDYSYKHTLIVPETTIELAPETLFQINSNNNNLNEHKATIRLLANQARLEEALSICDKAIELNKLAHSLYFLRASILQELNKNYEAIESLKQAIYIEPDYIMGHFTIGNLFIRLGIFKNAKRYFNNALDLLIKLSNDDILAESEGLSANYIRSVILENLQNHKTKV